MIEIKLPQNPVFIVGYPRSGTTLLQALLATQNHIHTLPETHFFNVIHKKILKTTPDGLVVETSLDSALKMIGEKTQLQFTPDERQTIEQLAKNHQLTAKGLFELIIAHFLPGKSGFNAQDRWLEKTPNHAYFLDDIFMFYPQARFINIIRHPVPAIFSRKRNLPNNETKPFADLAALWRRSVECCEAFAVKHPQSMLTMRYEDLIANTPVHVKHIADFLDMEMEVSTPTDKLSSETIYILPFETWKSALNKAGIVDGNRKYLELVPRHEAEEIEHLLMDKIRTYRYSPFFCQKPQH